MQTVLEFKNQSCILWDSVSFGIKKKLNLTAAKKDFGHFLLFIYFIKSASWKNCFSWFPVKENLS